MSCLLILIVHLLYTKILSWFEKLIDEEENKLIAEGLITVSEEKAFKLGGSNYYAPVQRFEDFSNNKKSEFLGKIKPSYKPGFTLSNLNDIMPKFVSETLKEGIIYFDTKLKGFANPDAIMTGMETRSSSPVKIIRNENFLSNIDGIYPCGEGAGYAGGIMSAAVDGIKCAVANISKKS